ncbi:hypothetical protein ACFL27_09340 [candidate division CSSED10-310 bacterium]|uniref:Uncharacterized protein n=1 Tax=candidate division CSSED10-310 bacterium TaxID=2855610 RepID=A0ABV6YW38_UNCC1
MKDQIALILCFAFGVFAIFAYFFPVLDELNKEYVINWTLIIFGFSMVLGIVSLLKSHVNKISRRSKGYQYNIVALLGFLGMSFFGFVYGIDEKSFFQYLFFTLQVPVQATMFSLLAFFIGSATFRAFRARTLEATLLLAAAIIVMLGQVPLTSQNIPYITEFKDWILDVPNTAAKRGILIGVGLGLISTAMKIILGIERTYLGGTGD